MLEKIETDFSAPEQNAPNIETKEGKFIHGLEKTIEHEFLEYNDFRDQKIKIEIIKDEDGAQYIVPLNEAASNLIGKIMKVEDGWDYWMLEDGTFWPQGWVNFSEKGFAIFGGRYYDSEKEGGKHFFPLNNLEIIFKKLETKKEKRTRHF
ncbi:hypothetical protein KKA09_01745 [Patescibacteria group bacterium]|nr:hypothetical protein [Patescibacteria group bacterium]